MNKHLKSIEIFHYVYGAMICFGGLFLLAIAALGGFLGSDFVADRAQDDAPRVVGAVLGVVGITLFVIVEIMGILNIYSGSRIGKRKDRTLSMVVAAINCLSVPLGLLLGIFTLIALSEDAAKQEYGAVPSLP